MTVVENGCENESSKGKDEVSLDAILVRIGEFGKFQIISYALIILPMVFNAVLMSSYIFLAGSVVHRCRVPGCDRPKSAYQEPWVNFAVAMAPGGGFEKCDRYVPHNRSSGTCFAANFDRSYKESCGTDFVFRDKELTISNDFDIYCSEEWKLSMVGTINVLGQIVGTPLGGYFSDRYGRRTMVAIGGSLSAVLGILRSFSPNYNIFLFLGFLENFNNDILHTTLFIIGIELVGQKARVFSCSLLPMFYCLGEVLLAIVAKNVHDWRWILRIFYIPALGHIALLWALPESVRWHLSRGDEDKAAEVLRKASKINKRKLSDETIEKLLQENRSKLQKVHSTHFPIKQAFDAFPWRILNCSLCWFSNVLVYHGLNLNSVLLGGNKYDNFMYLALVEVPAYILLFLTMNRFGRRYSLFLYLLICGVCLGATIFVSKDFYVLQLSMFLIGKMTITISYQVLYFFTSELFPTNVRSSMLSVCSMFGRFGAMLTPQTLLLAKYNESAPAILFSICAVVSAFMSLLFPETTNIELPSTMDEAEGIGRKKKEVKQES